MGEQRYNAPDAESRQIQTTLPAPIVDIEGGCLVPKNLGGIWLIAEDCHGSGVKPGGANTVAECYIALVFGYELGMTLGQIIKGVYIVNKKPSLYGDIALALVRRSPLCVGVSEHFDGEGDRTVAFCDAKRRNPDGSIETCSRAFSFADAKLAGLYPSSNTSSPWKKYPMRMLQMRARAFCLRDLFPDVLGGMSIVEEQQDVVMVDTRAAEISAAVNAERGLPMKIQEDDGSPAVEMVIHSPAVDALNPDGTPNMSVLPF